MPNLITVPVRSTVEESREVLECARRIETEATADTLDASRCERWGPFGVVVLSVGLARRGLYGLPPLQFIPPDDAECAEFLDEIGFPSSDENGPSIATERSPRVRHLSALDPLWTEQVADLTLNRVPGTSEESSHLVQLCLNELLQNVFEHAESRVGALVLSRWHAQDQTVQIAVADGGLGIPAALRRRRVEGLQGKRDGEVILAAVTQRGITSRQGGGVGGLGLKHLHSIATERQGRLIVVAHAARVVFRKGRAPSTRKSPYFRGTAIEMDFRPLMTAEAPADEVL